jgi:hypothetical protein
MGMVGRMVQDTAELKGKGGARGKFRRREGVLGFRLCICAHKKTGAMRHSLKR